MVAKLLKNEFKADSSYLFSYWYLSYFNQLDLGFDTQAVDNAYGIWMLRVGISYKISVFIVVSSVWVRLFFLCKYWNKNNLL